MYAVSHLVLDSADFEKMLLPGTADSQLTRQTKNTCTTLKYMIVCTGCGWYGCGHTNNFALYGWPNNTDNSANTAYLHCRNCDLKQTGRTNAKINAMPLV